MTQDTNTTGDTEPKPRLQICKPGNPPAEPAPPATSGNAESSPRLSFAPKKRAEESAPPAASPPPQPTPTLAAESQLKRPPPGSRLSATSEVAAPRQMPAPLTTPARGVTNSPFAHPAKPAKARGNLPLWIALFVLVLIVGGESAYILMQEEPAADAPVRKAPVVVANTAPAAKPTEVAANGAAAPTPVYAYLQSLSPEIASGTDPRLFINTQTFHLGQVIAPEYGLKWIRLDDKNRELEFVDKQGQHYIKKF